ncbi:MAG: hypothetical protein ABIP39_15530 [Polyangiaceae bacterium]
MIPKSKAKRSHLLKGGAFAGIVGGLVILLVAVFGNLAQGRGFWLGLKGASVLFLAPARASAPGFDAGAVLLGLLVHFAVAAFWGVLFALVVYGASQAITLAAGIGWGFAVWIGMYYVVLPIVGLGSMAHAQPVGAAIVEHVIFGVATALGFLPYQRTEPSGLASAH